MSARLSVLAAFLALAAFAAARPATAATVSGFDPLKAYGDRIVFDVYRGDDRIGRHVVDFRRDGDALAVHTRFDAAVEMLGITVYRFDHHSSASWRDGRLLDLTARTDDDGKDSAVSVNRRGGLLKVRGPDGVDTVSGGTFPSSHWNPGIVHASRLINTLTGNVDNVRIARIGVETVQTNAGPAEATRFRYSGDLHDVDAWYDGDGRWVKLRFRRGGSVIDYRCVQCVNTTRRVAGQ